jgi:hypothetical protein
LYVKSYVRSVAIKRGVESANDLEMDITPFTKYFNEVCKGYSKKLKLQQCKAPKQEICFFYSARGYLSDPNDKSHSIKMRQPHPSPKNIRHALDGVSSHLISTVCVKKNPRLHITVERSDIRYSCEKIKYYWAHI